MSSELGPVVKAAGLKSGPPVEDHEAFIGSVAGVEVVALRTGMGTARSAAATEVALRSGRVDHVLVVGVAGGLGETRLGDRIDPATVIHGGTGEVYTPHALGPLGRDPRGSLRTGDDFLVDPDRLADLVADGVVALDMETAAVGAVCEAHGVAWSVSRAISDLAGDEAVIELFGAGVAGDDGKPDAAALARYLGRRPWRARQLARLGRQAQVATRLAARDAIDAVEVFAAEAGGDAG
jgi:adenosylhomocysteine nucleosidase